MSSDILARVGTIYQKAMELCKKGHMLRAAENYGRAAEAARALGADNLVLLSMRLLHGHMHLSYSAEAQQSATADPGTVAAHRAEGVTLYSCVMEALERRRAAGTLQEGKCAAAEVEWRAGKLTQGGCDVATAVS